MLAKQILDHARICNESIFKIKSLTKKSSQNNVIFVKSLNTVSKENAKW